MNRLLRGVMVATSIFGLSVALLFLFDFYDMCGRDIVANVCELYQQQEVTGPLCQAMCGPKPLITTQCMTTSADKPVYKAVWEDKEIIIKQSYSTLSHSYSFQHLETEEDCRNEINATVHMLFNDCENCSRLTSKLADIADVDRDGHLSVLETKSIIQLLRTPEPSMLLVLNGSKISLNLYGYCGPIYVVETLPLVADTVFGHYWEFADVTFLPNLLEPVELTIKSFITAIAEFISEFYISETFIQPALKNFRHFVYSHYLRHRVPSLEERLNFTILHLEGILRLSNNPYGMIQACDTHLGNYGLSRDYEYKLIDYDEVYPQNYLESSLASMPCQSDEDCRIGDFEECMSKCNTTSNFCTSKLQKQLLQNICPTSLPLIFRNLHQDFEVENKTHLICMENAIANLAKYCLDIPLANNITELHQQIEQVKGQLLNISIHCNL